MKQYTCPKCGENIGTKAGTLVICKHCGHASVTKEDNLRRTD